MSDRRGDLRGPRLATRLLLAFVAVASLPLLAVPLVIREVSRSYDRTFARDLDSAGKLATAELEHMRADVAARLDAVLAGQLPGDAERLSASGESAALLDLAEPALASSGLDALEIVDGAGRILLCGQVPVRLGDTDGHLIELARQPGPHLEKLLYNRGEQLSSALAVVVVRPLGRPGGAILGGRFLDDTELARLRQLVRGDVTLQTVSGATSAPEHLPMSPHSRVDRFFQPSRREIDIPLGEPGASMNLHITLSDETLVQTKERIIAAALAAFAVALVVGLGLAVLLARRIVAPVGALVDGTKRLAQGDLSYRVEVRASAEIAQLVDAFNQMAADLATARERLSNAERIAAWEQIARALAHEIKNPLTPIAMAIETLQRTHDRHHPEFDRFFREGTATVLEEVARLKDLATEFSEFARWPKPVRSPTAPAEIVRSVVTLYGAVPPHTVHAEIAADLPLIPVDAAQIQRALVNLVKNAIEATPAGAVITVRARRDDAGVVLEVADNGPGLSSEVRRRMFEPYFTTKAEGTGLGLAIVHRIATEHAGRLSVDETPGGGATFRMHFLLAGSTLAAA